MLKSIGSFAKPDEIRFTALPKTRAERSCGGCCVILRQFRTVGDTTTLEDYSVLAKLREEED
jgi:acetyl-CoA synthetase